MPSVLRARSSIPSLSSYYPSSQYRRVVLLGRFVPREAHRALMPVANLLRPATELHRKKLPSNAYANTESSCTPSCARECFAR
eukprot:1726627-Rhodomonas_salina.2